ncbi:hypothetical protein R50072_02720 [Simiduia litorea]|uniref:transglutaminase domain-containing protein n=1 Tax=Simiduia litorea TaxID=1435348 RepID=UPI0036F348B7
MGKLIFWVGVLLLLSQLFASLKQQGEEQAVVDRALSVEDLLLNAALQKIPADETHQGPRPGEVEIIARGKRVGEAQLHTLLGLDNTRSAFFTYKFYGVENATASAMGVDKKHHFVNAYLEGYSPFETDNVFIPLSVLARRKTYMLDNLNYGAEEIWQTSKQAHVFTRGDCEDHAIALADWLIAMGEDARVALGRYQGGGHAWVVLIKDNQEYILEATKKQGLGLKRFPLAAAMPDYQPEYQFNRTQFWHNVGSPAITQYRSAQWLEKSRFLR